MWPVYVYRITYPAVSAQKLNLFQRAVLGLTRAGCQNPQEMSQLLGLHHEMVLLILAQCNSRGWIDGRGQPTESGIALLEEDEDRNLDLRTGLLFRDAISNTFWPRIVSDLEEIEPLPESGERPIFRFNRSSGYSVKPFQLRHNPNAHYQIDNREILEAYRNYRLDYFNARQLYGSDSLPEQVQAHGIQLMEESPEPMYVLTWLAEDSLGEKPWHLSDPFDLRQNVPWLEETFSNLLPGNTVLTKKLARVVGEPEPEAQTVEAWMRSMEHSIDSELLVEHAWASRETLVARHYTALKRRLMLIEQGLGKYELDSTLTDAQKLCEAVCQWLIKNYKPEMGILPRVKSHNRDLNAAILESLGLNAITKKSSDILAGQSLYSVCRVLEGRNESLKAMLFAALLSTHNRMDHPIRRISPDDLDLDQMLELADLRNKATHASGQEFEQNVVIRLGEFAMGWTLLFKDWM